MHPPRHTLADTHDFDSTGMPILIEAEFNGEPRKLVLQATRNGFSSPWTVLRVSITKPETPLGGVRAAATNFSRK